MSDLVPAGAPAPSLLAPLTDPAGGSMFTRLRAFTSQPAVRGTLPWFGAVAAVSGLALTWVTFVPGPQRVLYSQLDDAERASVVEALDKASIPYRVDNETGALSVDQDDLYRARALVASDGALASPQSGSDMLDNLPMGASRALEGERLRAAREHDLMLTIMEIDGVEAVRVHLAEGEKSVFVRENVPPTASVMVRLARGRQLSETQVGAIINLVAGSVPGLSVDAVRVVDQHGRLLTERKSADSERLELQTRLEEKLRAQVAQLLTPMLGEGNFTAEVQVDLDMDQVTSARESYDKDGVVRSETTQASQTAGAGTAAGVPGVLSNTPPPATVAKPGAPQGTTVAPAQPASTNGASSATRTYELGREVAVSNSTPGKVRRVSVAVALSAKAMKSGKAADVEQIKQLVSAAIGADPARGDQVAVVARNFESPEMDSLAFYETSWFATLLHNAVALIAVLLVLLLGVRPLLRVLKRKDPEQGAGAGVPAAPVGGRAAGNQLSGVIDTALLSRHVDLAQRLAEEKPDSAVSALRQMLREPAPE